MLCHSDYDKTGYNLQILIGNVSLLTQELLSETDRIVVDRGHEQLGVKGSALMGRCDSFVVETDIHHPTDVSLLWDAMRHLERTAL